MKSMLLTYSNINEGVLLCSSLTTSRSLMMLGPPVAYEQRERRERKKKRWVTEQVLENFDLSTDFLLLDWLQDLYNTPEAEILSDKKKAQAQAQVGDTMNRRTRLR